MANFKFPVYIGGLIMFGAVISWADTHYVRPDWTNPVAPYTSWETAASNNIQAAVNAAAPGDTVLVTNGTYALTTQVTIISSIVLQSVNGRDFTFINGNYPYTTNRCFSISGKGVVVDGFTITNGFAASNASVYGNNAGGGGIYLGASYLTNVIKNCAISKNQSHRNANWFFAGGGIFSVDAELVVSNCIISYNSTIAPTTGTGSGGGMAGIGGTLINCDIFGNTAGGGYGGGVYCCNLDTCRVWENSAYRTTTFQYGSGGGVYSSSGYIRNCLVKDNYVDYWGGGINYIGNNVTNAIDGCTIVSNYAAHPSNRSGGGICFGGTNNNLYNSIIYNNRSADGQPDIGNDINGRYMSNYFYNCCTSATNNLRVYACLTNAPLFADTNNADYRLRNNSPCINAGTNQAWMTGAFDLDGRIRIRYGVVDMGAYEFICAGSIYSCR